MVGPVCGEKRVGIMDQGGWQSAMFQPFGEATPKGIPIATLGGKRRLRR